MRKFNIVMVLDASGEHVLMCRRIKPPYQGLLNLVGGKVENGEEPLQAAYRELREETGITIADVQLRQLVAFQYPGGCSGFGPSELQAFVGRLRGSVQLKEEANPLCWVSVDENFFDMERFSGEGNIGHILETARRYCPEWLEAQPHRVSLEHMDDMQQEHMSGTSYRIVTDECPVGYALLSGEIKPGKRLVEICIHDAFRRCGIGRAALKQLEQIAAMDGCGSLGGCVRNDDDEASTFCLRCGFVPVSDNGDVTLYARRMGAVGDEA